MYYVILIFRSWNFICGAECKVAKIKKLDEIFIKKFNIRIFSKLHETYAAVADGSPGEDIRTQLPIDSANEKSLPLEPMLMVPSSNRHAGHFERCRIVRDGGSHYTRFSARNHVTRFLRSHNAIDRAKWIAAFSGRSRIIRRLCRKWDASKVEDR